MLRVAFDALNFLAHPRQLVVQYAANVDDVALAVLAGDKDIVNLVAQNGVLAPLAVPAAGAFAPGRYIDAHADFLALCRYDTLEIIAAHNPDARVCAEAPLVQLAPFTSWPEESLLPRHRREQTRLLAYAWRSGNSQLADDLVARSWCSSHLSLASLFISDEEAVAKFYAAGIIDEQTDSSYCSDRLDEQISLMCLPARWPVLEWFMRWLAPLDRQSRKPWGHLCDVADRIRARATVDTVEEVAARLRCYRLDLYPGLDPDLFAHLDPGMFLVDAAGALI